MSHNKSKQMQRAVRLLDEIIEIDRKDGHALPGSAVGLVKDAKRNLLRDIRKRSDARKRESRKGKPDGY